MGRIRFLSWNVNGIRAVHRKGFADWFRDESPDVLCVQETKAEAHQVPDDLREMDRYHAYFCSAKRRGYSGVGLWTRTEPEQVDLGFGVKRFDEEGRTIRADYGRFILFNVYFPNGGASEERLAYKMDFYAAFLKHLKKELKQQPNIVICGDVNTAHCEIDLARPKENETVSGFLPQERQWIDKLLKAGFLDTFRLKDESPGKYSWWDYKTRARERNVGWRIDYFFVSEALKDHVAKAAILDQVLGSDHCPVELVLKF